VHPFPMWGVVFSACVVLSFSFPFALSYSDIPTTTRLLKVLHHHAAHTHTVCVNGNKIVNIQIFHHHAAHTQFVLLESVYTSTSSPRCARTQFMLMENKNFTPLCTHTQFVLTKTKEYLYKYCTTTLHTRRQRALCY